MIPTLSAVKWKDHEARGRGIILSKGIVSVWLIITGAFIIAAIVQPQFISRYALITSIVWVVSYLILHFMNESNARVMASLYTAFLLIMIIGFSWSGGGIKGHGISLLPVVVAFAGLSIGRKQIWIFSVAAAIGGLILAIAGYAQWIPVQEALGNSPVIYWIYSMTAIFAITYIEFLSVERLQKALDETKSELRLRKTSEEKYKRIIESFQDIYYQTDMQGKITMITPSVTARAGYDPQELLGRKVTDVYADPVQRESFLKELKDRGSLYNYDLDLVAKSGQVINVIASSRVIFGEDGKPAGIEGNLHDITQRKGAEVALKKKNETLMEIAFLQSHIVRSPLTNILGIINLINKKQANDPMNLELIPQLDVAAKQLDAVVHQIVQKTNEIKENTRED